MVELLADLGASAEWTGANEVTVDAILGVEDRARPRPRPGDPGVVPARRAAARPLRASDGAAPGRGRDREAPTGHPHPRVHGARRRVRAERRLRPAHRRAPRQAHVPRRGLGDGHGERGDGRRPRGRGHDRRPCGLRAAHPGPLPLPRLARGQDRRDRLEHPEDHGRRPARRRFAPDPAGARRGGELRGARGDNRRRRDDRGRRAGRPDLDRPGVPQARHRPRGRRTRRSASRPARSSMSSTTSATRSRRSRAGSGRRSRPT